MPHRRVVIFVLAYPEFDLGVARRIDRFLEENEPERARLVHRHATLVFGLRNASRQDVLAHRTRVAKSAPPVGFATNEVACDPVDEASKLILICKTGTAALIELHRALYGGFEKADLRDDTPYCPHMAVATHKNRTVIESLRAAELGSLPIPGTVRALEVVEPSGDALQRLQTGPLDE